MTRGSRSAASRISRKQQQTVEVPSEAISEASASESAASVVANRSRYDGVMFADDAAPVSSVAAAAVAIGAVPATAAQLLPSLHSILSQINADLPASSALSSPSRSPIGNGVSASVSVSVSGVGAQCAAATACCELPSLSSLTALPTLQRQASFSLQSPTNGTNDLCRILPSPSYFAK